MKKKFYSVATSVFSDGSIKAFPMTSLMAYKKPKGEILKQSDRTVFVSWFDEEAKAVEFIAKI